MIIIYCNYMDTFFPSRAFKYAARAKSFTFTCFHLKPSLMKSYTPPIICTLKCFIPTRFSMRLHDILQKLQAKYRPGVSPSVNLCLNSPVLPFKFTHHLKLLSDLSNDNTWSAIFPNFLLPFEFKSPKDFCLNPLNYPFLFFF